MAGALAVGGIFVVRDDARDLYDGLTSGVGLVVVIGSAPAGLVTIALLWTRRFGLARLTSAAAVGAILVGLRSPSRPDFLPGQLTFEDAAAGDATLIALLVAVVIAVAILVPSLAFLYRLVLTVSLDPEFHPIGASDAGEPPMKYAGPRLSPRSCIAAVGGVTLFLASVTWLEVTGATMLLVGAALVVAAIATPDFLEADREN